MKIRNCTNTPGTYGCTCATNYTWVSCLACLVSQSKEEIVLILPEIMHVLASLATLWSVVKLAVGPRQANLVLIAYASSEGSGEPAHPRSLARTFAARSYKQ